AGATVTAGSAPTACTEDDGTVGTYWCAVSPDQDNGSNDVSITKDGYVKHTTGDTDDRANDAAAQSTVTVSDVKYGYKTNVSDEKGNLFTSGTVVTTGDGFGTTCIQEGSTNTYHCPVPLADTGLDIKVVKDNLFSDTSNNFTTDRTAHTDTQVFSNTTTRLFWFNVEVRDEFDHLLPGANLTAGKEYDNSCKEPDTPNGTYYCAVPLSNVDGNVKVARPGYVTQVFQYSYANSSADNIETVNATGVKYTVRMVLHDQLNATVSLNGTSGKSEVAAVSGTPAIRYSNGHAYIAATGNDTYRITQAGYLTTT
ncbi:MAG: hypothetical protein QGG26_17475, partial [Candidatus Undinarchaeales archaeon]|nr:hypothetical protein [Candidatus Undinarchaeales archaeon]